MSEHITPNEKKHHKLKEVSGVQAILFLLLVSPILISILIIVLIFVLCHFIYGIWLGLLVRLKWYPKDKTALFIYSDSPVWKEHIESKIIPEISGRAYIINWTERNKWKWRKDLTLKVFSHFSGVNRYYLKGKIVWGGIEYNPLAIVFNPWWKPKIFKFWQPFKDYKHGENILLERTQKQFFESLFLQGDALQEVVG